MSVETPSTSSTDERRRWPTWAKVLLGAGVGCFSLVVLVIALFAVLAWWAITPGEQEAPPTFIGEDTVAVIATSDPGKDEGLNALMVESISEFHRATWERIPETEAPFPFRFIRSMQRRQIESGRAGRELATSMPRDVAVLLVRRPDDAPTWVAVVNLAKGPRIYRWALNFMAKRAPDVETVRHRGETIIVVPDPDVPAICFLKSTFLAAPEVEVLKRAIDRHKEPEAVGPELAHRVAAMSTEWDIHGVLDNTTGELSEGIRNAALYLEQPEDFPVDLGDRELAATTAPDRWGDVAEMELGIDVLDASTMRLELDIAFEDADAAAAMLPRIERMLADWAEAAGRSSLKVSPGIDRSGSSVRIEIDLGDVDKVLAEGFERFLDHAGALDR
jgi:hypothetical protein